MGTPFAGGDAGLNGLRPFGRDGTVSPTRLHASANRIRALKAALK